MFEFFNHLIIACNLRSYDLVFDNGVDITDCTVHGGLYSLVNGTDTIKGYYMVLDDVVVGDAIDLTLLAA